MAMYGVEPMLPGGPDEDLMGALGRQRSEMATNLQASQAAMGVPGQAMPGSGAGPSAAGPAPPNRLQQLFAERRQEMESLQSQQQGVMLGQRLLQVLDPRLPKQARQFLFRELSSAVGIDPRGERSKQLGQMLTSLDPETLEGVRRSVAERVRANPGEVVNLVRGVFTGQVPITEVISGMGAPAGPAAADTGGGPAAPSGPTEAPPSGPTGGGGMMALGGPGIVSAAMEATRRQTGGVAPGQPGAVIQPPGFGTVTRMPAAAAPPAAGVAPPERAVAPINREIAPELAGILGLVQEDRYRNRDVLAAGWRRIPTSYEDQQRLANDIRGNQDGVINTMMLGSQLADLIRGRPEVLDIVRFRLPGTDNIMSLNVPSLADQVVNMVQGWGRLFGGRTPSREDMDRFVAIARGPSSEDTPLLTRAIDRLTAHIVETSGRSGDAAEIAARVRGLIVPLAFQMASAKGQTGRFLSDRDVELMLNEIGLSASPRQMEASIRDMVQRIHDGYNVRMRTHTGGEVPLTPGISQEVADILVRGGIAPQPLLDSLYGPGVVRARPPPRNELIEGPRGPLEAGPESVLRSGPEGRAPPALVRPRAESPYSLLTPAPTPAPGPSAEPELAPGEAGTTGAGTTGRMPAAPPIRRFEPRRLERTPGQTIHQEEEDIRRRTEEDRAAVLEHRRIERGRFELQRSAEERAARVEERTVEEMRRRRIQQAFQAIAAALRPSSASVSIPSGAGGGEQDAAAFRIAAPPQRQPPRPVEAQRFQRR